jgi:hypothetical protein
MNSATMVSLVMLARIATVLGLFALAQLAGSF